MHYISPDDSTGCVSKLADGWLPIVLLKYLMAGLVVLFAEDTLPTDGIVFAFATDLLGVNEQGDVFHDKLKGLSHRFIQRPGNPS